MAKEMMYIFNKEKVQPMKGPPLMIYKSEDGRYTVTFSEIDDIGRVSGRPLLLFDSETPNRVFSCQSYLVVW